MNDLLSLLAQQDHRWLYLYDELTYINIETFAEPQIPCMRPYSRHACGVVSCCLICASPASVFFFRARRRFSYTLDEAMLLESIRLDWFHNVRRLVGNSRRGSAPSELSCDLCKITGGHQSYNACLGWTSRQKRHESGVCNSNHCLPPNAAALSSSPVLGSSCSNGHVESAYPVPCR